MCGKFPLKFWGENLVIEIIICLNTNQFKCWQNYPLLLAINAKSGILFQQLQIYQSVATT